VYAWSAMRDPRDADEAGGRPPFGLLHPRSKHLPVDFLRTLRSALLEAAGVIVGLDAEDRIVGWADAQRAVESTPASFVQHAQIHGQRARPSAWTDHLTSSTRNLGHRCGFVS
jgi:hypothetical protein